jgi:hypothetical protein
MDRKGRFLDNIFVERLWRCLKYECVDLHAYALPAGCRLILHRPKMASIRPLKWSGKFGQRAKMYPTRTNGYENDKATELFRPV